MYSVYYHSLFKYLKFNEFRQKKTAKEQNSVCLAITPQGINSKLQMRNKRQTTLL